MLTIEDIIALSEYVDVHINPHSQKHYDKGRWGKGENEDVVIYLKNIDSQEDFDITLLHEFIHARNFCILEKDFDLEFEVEKEAIETYKTAPEVLSIIKQFYHLESFGRDDWSKK